MADCHRHFLSFEAAISPAVEEIVQLLELRQHTRRVIASECEKLGLEIAFHPQGSFRLLTAVKRDGLDLDDGVLFHADQFPAEPSIEKLHQIVFWGLRRGGFSSYARVPCLRVLQRGGVRMDIVIYLENGAGRVQLAHRKDGWIPTHSSHLIAWFENIAGSEAGQLRRLIKYYKIWAARVAPNKMPSGVALTILISTLYQRASRDDVALVRTLEAVDQHLEAGRGCRRPTPPIGEELLGEELSPVQMARFVDLLRGFIRGGREALEAPDVAQGVAAWRTLFGPRFGALDNVVSPEARARQLRLVLEGKAERLVDRSHRLSLERNLGNESWTR